MSSLGSHLTPKTKLLTNVLIGHDERSMSFVDDKSCHYCQVLKINVSNSNLDVPYDSNQLSETRGFFVLSPELVTTPFISFSSTRMALKTQGLVTVHSGCVLLPELHENSVLAPYLIRQTLGNLVEPESHAPPYAFLIPPIYKSIFELSSDLRNAASYISAESILNLPFCSSFICSKNTYKKFYDFITRLVNSIWDANCFHFQWFDDWKDSFAGRETGLLLERASALWFALNPDVEVTGDGFGNGYPASLLSKNRNNSLLQVTGKVADTGSYPLEVYN